MDISSYSSALNESQLEAVTYCDGPSLVIAGAGSGKTRVLTYKIAYLLQNGLDPWNILALTFTNKAAREMNERIFQICGEMDLRGLWSGTFHSLFARLLRFEHESIDYPADFTIYDTSDSRSLIKGIVKELGLDDNKKYKPNVVSSRISEAKNHLILPAQYSADSSIQRRDHADGLGEIYRIYQFYQQRLKAAFAMDFDDLLLNTFLLLRDNEDIREHYKARFRYILVDEYQDTNMAQHRILSLLTNPDSHICVVGDDAQSIYGFRGADISNILNFQQQYPTTRVIKLECNYRSTKTIVEAANCIISHNRSQIPKKIYSAGEQGDPIQLFVAQTDKEEAQKVSRHILKLKRKDVGYNDIALLYRTNAQSRVFEEAFQSANIPYRIYGGLSFYQRKEIKDVLAYCRLVVNLHDEEAFRRIINYPTRGIGATTLSKLENTAIGEGVSLWDVAVSPEDYNLTLSANVRKKVEGFTTLILSFRDKMKSYTASSLVKEIISRSGIAADICMERSAESIARQENVDELLSSICAYESEQGKEQDTDYVSLAEYLSTVSLLTDADQGEDDQPRVTLMTVHAAKGLEFDAVFITGLEEELFPNANARLFPKEMEEERRLFYVAVTRAKRFCYLSYARSRFRYGTLQLSEPSIFIDEIDPEYIEKEQSYSAFPSSSSRYGGYSSERRSYSSERSNNFDQFFGSPSEDDFRNGSVIQSGSDDRYGSGYGSYSSRNDYRNRSYQHEPRRVAPPAPPSGFKRVSSQRSSVTSAKSPASAAPGNLQIGTRINHERFGMGRIVGMEGTGDSAKIRVEFEQAGVKNLLVKFAKFTLA